MCSLWRSPMTRSPESTSGDFIFNLAIADSGKLEIGTRPYNNWQLHEAPDFLPFCQPGALSIRLYCRRMPRHHTRPPGRYIRKPPTASIRLSGKPGNVPTTVIFGYLIFCSSSTAMIHTFGDHRLRTHGECRFIVRQSCWPSTCPHPHRPSLPISELLFFKNGDDA